MLKEITLLLALYMVSAAEACECNCDCGGKYKINTGDCCPDDRRPTKPPPTPRPCHNCPSGYYPHGAYGCFATIVSAVGEKGFDHDEAKAECRLKHDGTLAKWDNASMFDDVHTAVVGMHNGSFQLYWLAGVYHSTGDFGAGFYWEDGEKLISEQYEWWEGNNPNGAEDGFCLYAFGNETHNNCLSYTYCTVGLGYICQHNFICDP